MKDASYNNKICYTEQSGAARSSYTHTSAPDSANENLLESVLPGEPHARHLQADKPRLFQQLLNYRKASSKLSKAASEINYLFQRFLLGNSTRVGLRLQFDPTPVAALGTNWVDVDLAAVEYRSREANRVSLDLEDEVFDMVLLTGLDRISRPASLITEVRRVMKRRGQVWAQSPLCHSRKRAVEPLPYWQFTPDGLQVLFENFDEIRCSVYQRPRDQVREDSFFYGLKPEISPEAAENRAHPALFLLPL